MNRKNSATVLAILAAALYAVNIPISKLLLRHIDAPMLAALLYLGAGIGLFLYGMSEKLTGKSTRREPLTRQELPFVAAMIILDIAAPILLMLGIARTASANVSLLNNFEIVVTSIVALVVFKETISRKLRLAIALVTAASIILSFEGTEALDFNIGSLYVLAACLCWGFENNCTKMMSHKSSVQIVTIKGVFSGLGSLIVAKILQAKAPDMIWIMAAAGLGFVAYGLSIHFYILAQKELGAAKTSGYYSIAPFLGVAFSMLLLGERPGFRFYLALSIMTVSTILMVRDSIALQHTHEHEHAHIHEHRHEEIVHLHEHTHRHAHLHIHGSDESGHRHRHHDELQDHHHEHQTDI